MLKIYYGLWTIDYRLLRNPMNIADFPLFSHSIGGIRKENRYFAEIIPYGDGIAFLDTCFVFVYLLFWNGLSKQATGIFHTDFSHR